MGDTRLLRAQLGVHGMDRPALMAWLRESMLTTTQADRDSPRPPSI